MINNNDDIKKAVENAVKNANGADMAQSLINSMNSEQKKALEEILADPSKAKKLLETKQASQIAEIIKKIGKD